MGSTSSKRAYLSTVDIFQDLTPSDMEHLERITAMVTCEAGRGFYNPDEPAEVLFILKRGEVVISRVSPEGKKLIVETLGPGWPSSAGDNPAIPNGFEQRFQILRWIDTESSKFVHDGEPFTSEMRKEGASVSGDVSVAKL